jgi:nicotinamide-nucleotide amidase
MATGAAEQLGADYGAGHHRLCRALRRANENPVGTIFLALHAPHGVWSRKLSYPGPRGDGQAARGERRPRLARRELVRARTARPCGTPAGADVMQ